MAKDNEKGSRCVPQSLPPCLPSPSCVRFKIHGKAVQPYVCHEAMSARKCTSDVHTQHQQELYRFIATHDLFVSLVFSSRRRFTTFHSHVHAHVRTSLPDKSSWHVHTITHSRHVEPRQPFPRPPFPWPPSLWACTLWHMGLRCRSRCRTWAKRTPDHTVRASACHPQTHTSVSAHSESRKVREHACAMLLASEGPKRSGGLIAGN